MKNSVKVAVAMSGLALRSFSGAQVDNNID